MDKLKQAVRRLVRQVAVFVNWVSGGRVTPNAVTVFGVLMHGPIAVLIGLGDFVLAAILLVIFGLFDTLDGELARLQKRASLRGMLLDASTDRMKEVMLYTGAAYVLAGTTSPRTAVWAAAACGASICVSYVKAKGEGAIASQKHDIPHAVLNRMFSNGVFSFEIRMALLVIGLAIGQLAPVLVVIAIGAALTALYRLILISRRLT